MILCETDRAAYNLSVPETGVKAGEAKEPGEKWQRTIGEDVSLRQRLVQ